MRIGFIGAGKVGCSLGKYLSQKNGQWNNSLSGYFSRNPESAREAAHFTGSQCFPDLETVTENSDMIFITVPDRMISEVWNQLVRYDLNDKIICHCSGVLSSEIFQGNRAYGAYVFSIHPLLAVSSKHDSFREFSKTLFTIEGSPEKLDQVKSLFTELGNKVRVIKAADKVKYHGSAVLASNLSLGLLETAIEALMDCGFSRDEAFDALKELMMGNVNHLRDQSLEESLTGPIERADLPTVESHMAAFSGNTREIYRLLSAETLKIAKRKNIDRDYKNLEEKLNG